ncbi:MAG: biotin--[Ruminiclostridium sp.]|nr:biotin--[acetyl-CoA-carboxylase] ligase [Ruminiclostridium sp.]
MFDLSPYCAHPGLTIQFREEVTSTNTLLRQQAEEGAPEGTVLIAARQTAGRGRRDRSFFSPADTGLYLSVLLRPQLAPQEALYLTTCAAAAGALALEEFGLRPQIKWVNDLFLEGKKVCGILTEGAIDPETMGLRYAILGIGVNLFPPEGGFPPDLPEAGAVFRRGPDPAETRKQLAGRILDHFFRWYPNIQDRPLFEAYRDRSLVLGQPITIHQGGTGRPATALDLAPDFSLRVREADGRETLLSSGEVSIRPL